MHRRCSLAQVGRVVEGPTCCATLIAQNRRVSFDYELSDRYEAGIVLIGSEVKTLRNGSCDLGDGWVAIDGDQAYLKGAFLPKLQHAAYGHEERRVRKLLLHRREIEQIRKSIDQGGLTVVPTMVYWRNGHCKVEISIAKGKKQGDKRQAIKAKELDREAKAAMSRGRKDA
jgi:SsrA-binding protein